VTNSVHYVDIAVKERLHHLFHLTSFHLNWTADCTSL